MCHTYSCIYWWMHLFTTKDKIIYWLLMHIITLRNIPSTAFLFIALISSATLSGDSAGVWVVWVNWTAQCHKMQLYLWTSQQDACCSFCSAVLHIFLMNPLCSGWFSCASFSFSLSLSVFIRVVWPPLSALTPSLPFTECHRVSVWSFTYWSGVLPLRRPAPHYSRQHRPCLSIWEDPLQVLQVSLYSVGLLWHYELVLGND